jgi:phosphatidylinositol-bisphosphatase
MIFWIGDLNYRIMTSAEMSCEQVKAMADAYQFPALLKLDQLLIEVRKKNVFSGFTEADIDFKPSYKYDPNTDNWDSR